MIYFDNAATSYPKPSAVTSAVYNALTKYGGNPGRSGHKMSINAAKIVYGMREKAANFFGNPDPERVILTKNCTEALNIAIFSIMKKGGNAIISNFEHNSVIRPLEYLKKSGICDYKIAETTFENPKSVIKAFEKLIDRETKMIVVSHATNVTGEIAPVRLLSELCKQKGLILCLDAAQTAGIVPINMESSSIDILCAPGHKSLMGPTGTGLLIIGKDVTLSPFIFGGTGSTSGRFDMPDFLPDMIESGTVNVVGAAGLKAGMDYIENKGIGNIYKHDIFLAQNFYNKLNGMKGVLLYSHYPELFYSVPTISFNIKGYDSTEVSDILNKKNIAVRGGLHCAPLAHKFLGTRDTGTVRASFSYFNTLSEVDYACSIIESIKLLKN